MKKAIQTDKTKEGLIILRRQRAARPKVLYRLITKLVVIITLIACAVGIIVMQSTKAEKLKELAQIQKKAEEIEAENVELQRILDNDDMDAYMEKVAIEKMNYAYPNERRYYDTSRN